VQDDFSKKNCCLKTQMMKNATKQIEIVQGDVPASFDSKIPLRCSKHHMKLIEIAYSRGGV